MWAAHSNLHILQYKMMAAELRTGWVQVKSQSHETIEVGRCLWRSLSSTPMLKAGSAEQFNQDCLLLGFEHLQEWRHHNLSGQHVPMFNHPCDKKKIFLTFKWNFLCFRWCTLPLVLSLGRVWLSLLCFVLSGVYIHWQNLPWAFSSRAVTAPPIWEMLQYFNCFCGPSLDSLQYCQVLIVLVRPELDLALQVGFATAEQKWKYYSVSDRMLIGWINVETLWTITAE